jgi:hypothetical protein
MFVFAVKDDAIFQATTLSIIKALGFIHDNNPKDLYWSFISARKTSKQRHRFVTQLVPITNQKIAIVKNT